jgi:nucleoside 2-deoxyribosyltransferase
MNYKGMVVYLSGPITGVPDYKSKFAAAGQLLIDAGCVVINPAEMDNVIKADGGVPDGVYMNADIRLLEAADAIALLPGWENSKGAKAEWLKAVRLGKRELLITDTGIKEMEAE